MRGVFAHLYSVLAGNARLKWQLGTVNAHQQQNAHTQIWPDTDPAIEARSSSVRGT